jgi:hypothetical protein
MQSFRLAEALPSMISDCLAALADIGLPRRLPPIGQWQTLTAGWQRADSGYQLAP